MTDDLNVIEPQRSRTVPFRGREIEIRPLTVRQIARIAPRVAPLADAINDIVASIGARAVDVDSLSEAMTLPVLVSFISENLPVVISAAAAAIDADEGWVGDAELDEFQELVIAIVAVNMDFFARRYIPRLRLTMREAAGVADARSNGDGQTRSRPLFRAGTA